MGKQIKLVALTAFLCALAASSLPSAVAQTPISTQNRVSTEGELLEHAKREPQNARILESLGEYYMRAGKWPKSVLWFTKAAAVSPSDESIGYDLAFAEMQDGELGSASRQAKELLKRTDSAKFHSLIATIDERSADYLNAAKEYHRAAEIDPTESNIFELATYLVRHKNYEGFLDESVRFFRYGASQFPKSSRMMVGLGVALYASNQYDEAVRVLCAAVDLDPHDRRPIEFLGKAARVSPELAAEVDRRLQDFAERYPQYATSNYYYALSLWRQGGEEGKNLDKIEKLLQKAELQAPGWYEPHYLLGVLYTSEKRYPYAIREMQKTAEIAPDFSAPHFQLAKLYSQTGDKERAAREAEVVKRLKDSNRENEMKQQTGER